MPNWCSNKIVFDTREAKDTDFVKKLVLHKMGVDISNDEVRDGWFSYLVPLKEGLSYSTEYGTKWDIEIPSFSNNSDEGEQDTLYEIESGVFYLLVDTAWSPPVAFVDKLCALNPGLEVTLMYCESGCDYIGYYARKDECIDSVEDALSEICPYPDEEGCKDQEEFEIACEEYYDKVYDSIYEWFDDQGLDGSYMHTGG